MRYLSVCSGIEAASVAWHDFGWEAVGFSEIEKFPSEVLAKRFPDVKNYGDMTRYKEWDIDGDSVDLLVGGTPCQAFSVAGLRKGLEDPRGNLSLTFVGMVDHFKPEWVVWENVPGVLSSNGGRDFGSFIGAMASIGYGFAWRCLDAQFFGTPQRRRRVFLVGHSSGDSRRAGEVLFEPESLSGNHSKSKQAGKSIAEGTITGSVSSKWAKGTGGPAGDECYNLVPVLYQNNQTDARLKEEPHTSQTVLARWGTGGGNTPIVRHTTRVRRLTVTECDISNETFQLKGIEEDTTYASTSEANAREILHSLQCKVGEEAFAEWGLRILNSFQSEEVLRIPMYGECIRRTSSEIKSILDDSSLPRKEDLPSEWMRSLWERGPDRRTSQGRELAEQLARQLGKTLPVMPHKNTQEKSEEYRLAVRRLTPTEVERLQGFPDGWTDVRTNTPDSPRYKAIGNSMAVPVMSWIGNRIRSV